MADKSRLQIFQKAYQDTDLTPLIQPELLRKFWVEYGREALEEVEQLVEDNAARDAKIIFSGHRGCGKSTLLAEFGRNVSDRYLVVFFSIAETIEMSDVDHINILFAIGVNLMLQAEREEIEISEATRKSFYQWFAKRTRIETEMAMKAEVSAGFNLFNIISSEAEPLYLQALEIKQRQLGADHLNVAGSLNNLALLYYLQGRYNEAEPLCLQALEIRQRQLGADHPDVAQSLNSLAGLYKLQGRYSEAELLFERALAIRKKTLGVEHSKTKGVRQHLERLWRKIRSPSPKQS